MQESAVVFELLWATHFTSEIISPRSRRPWKVGLSAVIFANYNNSTTLLTPPLIIRLQFIRPLTLQIFCCPLTTNVIKCHKCCSSLFAMRKARTIFCLQIELNPCPSCTLQISSHFPFHALKVELTFRLFCLSVPHVPI